MGRDVVKLKDQVGRLAEANARIEALERMFPVMMQLRDDDKGMEARVYEMELALRKSGALLRGSPPTAPAHQPVPEITLPGPAGGVSGPGTFGPGVNTPPSGGPPPPNPKK